MKRDVVVASAVRTPIGDLGGALSQHTPSALAALVSREAMARAAIDPSQVEQSLFGNVIHTEARDMYLARAAALDSGVPETASALTLNRLCGSGLQAVASGAEQIQLERADVVLAGGAECMSRAGHLVPDLRFGMRMGDAPVVDMMVGALTDPFGNGHMGDTAERVAARHGIARAAQDALALESHRRAASAIRQGRFKEQSLAVPVGKGSKACSFETDEHVRGNLSLADLEKLRPAFQRDGTVTAGNASGINDGAAALILCSAKEAERSALPKLAVIRDYAVCGVAPEVMGMGPVPAVTAVLDRVGLSVADLSCIECNEAFAAQACAVAEVLGFPPEITNPNGGAIALGHPVGASGAIILVKLIYELRRTAGRFGLATMCIGGGQGIAMIIENPDGN